MVNSPKLTAGKIGLTYFPAPYNQINFYTRFFLKGGVIPFQNTVNTYYILPYFSQTLDEYGRGVKNSVDVLNAFKKDIDLKKEYSERRRNYQWIQADLFRLAGK